YDIFRAWAQKNLPKHVKGSVNQRIATEAPSVGRDDVLGLFVKAVAFGRLSSPIANEYGVGFPVKTRAGFLELKHEMKTQSRLFHMQDLYENKIFFTDYGVKAQRKEEKPAAPEGSNPREREGVDLRRAAHVNNLVSVKTLSDRLNESHANSQLAKEFFAYLYGSRKNKSMDIFESLRQAYKDSSKAFALTSSKYTGWPDYKGQSFGFQNLGSGFRACHEEDIGTQGTHPIAVDSLTSSI
ncbi:unnamed protein product, partial [Symbiodinium microadriaticum]